MDRNVKKVISDSSHIDWLSQDSLLLLNPKLPHFDLAKLTLSRLPNLQSHIWLSSSGTTSKKLNLYALSNMAFLHSAKSVNEHLRVSKSDIWANFLPRFHVGGLSIFARAFVAKNIVHNFYDDTWTADRFHKSIEQSKATLTSLVPTQVYDLVKFGQPCPQSLRAIVVGGAKLSENLYLSARLLGYPLLPSFGMTECASQIATASLESLKDKSYPKLQILNHVQIKIKNKLLAISSDSLFTASAEWSNDEVKFVHRVGDWYETQDIVKIEGNTIIPLGRIGDLIKISGELVSVSQVNEKLNLITGEGRGVILPISDSRKGHNLTAIFDLSDFALSYNWVNKLNQTILPVAKIKYAYFIEKIPRTDLGKVKTNEILKKINMFKS